MALLKMFLRQDPYGTGNLETLLLPSFHRISSKLYEDIAYHRGIQAVTFFGNWPNVLQNLSHIRCHIHGAIQAVTFLKIVWHLETFLHTGPYGTRNFKVLFLP